MGNQFLALSMFIMLLSFFIVLNTMSKFEEDRSRPVLMSIAAVFGSNPVMSNQPAPSAVPSPDQKMKKGDVMDQLKDLFTSRIAGVKVQKNRLGTSMIMQVPLDEFEKNVLDAGRTRTPLTDTLVSLLQTQSATPYRMDILMGLGRNPAEVENRDPGLSRQSIRKAALFANVLENAGMPRKLISAGLGSLDKDYVELHFSRYNPLFLRAVPQSSSSPEERASE